MNAIGISTTLVWTMTPSTNKHDDINMMNGRGVHIILDPMRFPSHSPHHREENIRFIINEVFILNPNNP